MGVTVLSKSLSASDVVKRIDAFLGDFRATLEGTTAESWTAHVEAMITKLTKPPKRLGEEAGMHWALIRNETLRWQWRDEIVEALKSLSCGDAVALYDKLIQADTRRRVNSLAYGKAFPI